VTGAQMCPLNGLNGEEALLVQTYKY